VAVSLLAIALVLLTDGWTAFGARATGARRQRMVESPEWKDGRFVNPQPLVNHIGQSLRDLLDVSPYVTPAAPMPVSAVVPSQFRSPSASGLRVTWFGHSTTLLELDGVRVLTDPVWSQRVSPTRFVGPRRWTSPLIPIESLPPVDVVVISHDHYDHLDFGTIRAMRGWTNVFVVPLGIGAHLASWGIPPTRIIELDWWQDTTVRGVRIVATPARHASGRILFDNDAKLWAGFALIGRSQRVYYSGDTGLFPALADIGARLGPFDLTMIEVGQYGRGWPDWHLGPEQAVRAHQMVRGRVMLPVHWGMFALAYHAWTEPMERALVAGAAAGVTVIDPKLGESVDPMAPMSPVRWWPPVPWRRAEQDPIVATQMGPQTGSQLR
jgi:L-ascorbate metabolism protein UlaG (beta-lactamase superfamily)